MQKRKALNKLKSFALRNRLKKERDAKAVAHANTKIEKTALKKAIAKIRLHSKLQKALKKLSQSSQRRIETKAFQAWKKYAQDQKKQRQFYQTRRETVENFHKKKVLKGAFSKLKTATRHVKQQQTELEKRAVDFVARSKKAKASKFFSAWKQKASQKKNEAMAEKQKELLLKQQAAKEAEAREIEKAKVQKELDQDLEQYYDHCNQQSIDPDKAIVVELIDVAQCNVPTQALFAHYKNYREAILSRAYDSLKERIVQIAIEREALATLMHREYTNDVKAFKAECWRLGIERDDKYHAELSEVSRLIRKAFASDPQGRVNNYRAIREIPLKTAYHRLSDIIANDYQFFKNMCLQSMIILNKNQILGAAKYPNNKKNSKQMLRIAHNLTLHLQTAQKENLAAQITALRHNDHRDHKHTAESQSNTTSSSLKEKVVKKTQNQGAMNALASVSEAPQTVLYNNQPAAGVIKATELNPSVVAFFKAWDSQQSANAGTVKHSSNNITESLEDEHAYADICLLLDNQVQKDIAAYKKSCENINMTFYQSVVDELIAIVEQLKNNPSRFDEYETLRDVLLQKDFDKTARRFEDGWQRFEDLLQSQAQPIDNPMARAGRDAEKAKADKKAQKESAANQQSSQVNYQELLIAEKNAIVANLAAGDSAIMPVISQLIIQLGAFPIKPIHNAQEYEEQRSLFIAEKLRVIGMINNIIMDTNQRLYNSECFEFIKTLLAQIKNKEQKKKLQEILKQNMQTLTEEESANFASWIQRFKDNAAQIVADYQKKQQTPLSVSKTTV